MLAAKYPDNEQARLNALKALNVLDTPPEEHFDRITRMAKRIFKVSISAVSLIDENRQWFKSCIGLNATETARDISFCGHAILENETFIIEDTLQDDRFYDNPLVTGAPFIRFYAGHPLKTPCGNVLGTLCIIDTSPKTLTDEDLDTLKDLACIVQDELAALQMATYDYLTGISNRRGFVKLANHSLNIGIRQNYQSFLAYFDLDNFKPINDNYGHEAGDAMLKYFAKQMTNTFRESDIYARLGGDEFAVLLTNTNKILAIEALDRFSKNIKEHSKQDNIAHPISFSQGLVKYDKALHQNIEKLINDADKAMFADKKDKSNE